MARPCCIRFGEEKPTVRPLPNVPRVTGGYPIQGSQNGLAGSTGSAGAFPESGRFPAQTPQVVQFCTAHLAAADDLDVVDHGSMDREDALNALPEAHLADGDRLAHSGIIPSDQGAFKHLQALFLAFSNLDVNLDLVADAEFRMVRTLILFSNFGQRWVDHDFYNVLARDLYALGGRK